jgi:small subunit ribosomal protein S25e
VILDKVTYDRIIKDVPTFKFISPAILIERLKINGSLARIAIRHLEKEGTIRRVIHHNGQLIYSECRLVYVLLEYSVLTNLSARVTGGE